MALFDPATIQEIVAKGTTSDHLLLVTLGVYGVAWLLAWVRPSAVRWVVLAGTAVHMVATVWRGLLIDFFPLTNKLESFSAAALALALVVGFTAWPKRLYLLPSLTLVLLALTTALSFPIKLSLPPPLMRTIWYPLHVPLSFVAYGLWAAAAAGGLAYFRDRDPAWLRRIDYLGLLGFGCWSVGMVCGGIWGVVAWGAYFLWDPKVVWSVLLWFHYSSLIHVKLTPSLSSKPWVRPVLALFGLLWVFVAYVGTSFFFGNSSHAF